MGNVGDLHGSSLHLIWCCSSTVCCRFVIHCNVKRMCTHQVIRKPQVCFANPNNQTISMQLTSTMCRLWDVVVVFTSGDMEYASGHGDTMIVEMDTHRRTTPLSTSLASDSWSGK
jgi:hypothetical protein